MLENLVNRLILVKKDCLACLFLGKLTNYSVKVYFFTMSDSYTEPCLVLDAILIHGGPEITCDELKLAEASFC